MDSYSEIPMFNNTAKHQFEMEVEGATAFISYKLWNNKVTLIHTEIPVELKGKGVAMALIKKTIEYLETQKYRLIPLCPVVRLFIRKNPEWLGIVDVEASAKLGIAL